MSSFSPFSKEELLPQEEMLEVQKRKGELFIGLPKETYLGEKRVCLTPDAVSALCTHGHRIVVETGAGVNANYSDKEYSEAGAKISYNIEEAFKCNIVLKVAPPTEKEIEFINPQTILISSLQLKTQSKQYFDSLAKKKITAVAFDFIKDEQNSYPIVKSLSEIAGTASILIAAELMSGINKGNGLLLGNIGGVPPSSVVIFGAGTVGEYAAKTAIGLGARVKVFDNSISKLRKLQDCLHAPIYTSTVQPKSVAKALMRCDVAIGAIRGKNRSPICATEDMVKTMKEGAVIVDVSIDRGGCFETSNVTTHNTPTFVKYGVIHYCVPNIPARYARTASVSISNIFTPYLLNIAEEGGFENSARFDKSLRNGMYFYHGILTNKTVADWFDLPYRDINLLLL
ncbi:MAG: alanine dehydrogenase [Flavobacteriia bacterium]|nr:alanine dehydrogenase [Flavobacteriia bacterium]OIP45235.1 MAG: alanine dehydrogenase [Flavobacteriaceae bacterium CG2_30_31_66]PIV97517.1 MAG: alanine dehydrogenase [Flavobacteriaceae bacterium CG17_big_fil_post_rev_8_21_14_2_50_31_13]PIX13037.1 MAG: alanine dehydrogenase [Flavobacteriaceae bacterium CG_4_8_14_3_um_filter_31_8]PIY14281.1 MAG: alanine dehydrogenase [Flavobacteriaceae bacterium CG_4_10_14_3_um_filter_31_253]PIZ10133.1 MAG: alanine dehydrogenase [Flavobacteriaceae bacterium C